MILLNLLVSQNVLTELEARAIEREAESSAEPIDVILEKHNIAEAAVLTARNAIYGIPVYSGSSDLAAPNLYDLISKSQAEQYLAVPLGLRDFADETDPATLEKRKELMKSQDFIKNKQIVDEVLIGVVDPERKNVLDALQFILTSAGVSYKVYLISFSEFKRRFQGYSSDGVKAVLQLKERKSSASEDEYKLMDITNEESVLQESLAETMPMVKLVNILLKNAIVSNASDIHIENMGDHLRVRTRIDGILSTKFTIPIDRAPAVVARIKIMCALKLDVKRKPQDGRFSVMYQEHKVDFRVSTFPTYYGEKVEIRILDSYKGLKKLDDIGFSPKHLALVKKAIKDPYGIILISGPTGAGKTTTLYSILNELDKEALNIVSLEDPIEYNMPGVNQSQVDAEIGYTFATGLRSILRQDPNVIMVGEIRDAETAQLAIQAALTGHLVFSTIHTNNSVEIVTRLEDMGVAPYVIAPTMNLAIAQRLVRRIAPGCGVQIDDPGIDEIIAKAFQDLPDQYKKQLPLDKKPYKAVGNSTNSSGLKGRIPVFEVLEINRDMEELILKKASVQDMYKAARQNGFITMEEDGIIKSIQGLMPFSEVESLHVGN